MDNLTIDEQANDRRDTSRTSTAANGNGPRHASSRPRAARVDSTRRSRSPQLRASRSPASPRSTRPSPRRPATRRPRCPRRAGRRRRRPAARRDVPRRRPDRRPRAVGPGVHRCRRQRRRHRHGRRSGREPERRRARSSPPSTSALTPRIRPLRSTMLTVTARSSAASSPAASRAPIRRSPRSIPNGSSASLRTPESSRSRSTTQSPGVNPADVISGIDWVVANADDLDIGVINLSFGTGSTASYQNDALAAALERAWDAGIVVVVAAGNDGAEANGLASPANDPFLISVGVRRRVRFRHRDRRGRRAAATGFATRTSPLPARTSTACERQAAMPTSTIRRDSSTTRPSGAPVRPSPLR